MTTNKIGRTLNKAIHCLSIGTYCLLLTACVSNDRLERSLEAAGDNRKELEHVLQHYKEDSLKYQAACYLLLGTPLRYGVEVAEIEFYEAGTEQKLPVHLLDIPKAGSASHAAKMMIDGDVLSYYAAAERGNKTLMFDLKEDYPIGKIVFVPRNDDNFIRPGDKYELFYQDGVRGWKSLGRQIADKCTLEYKNIPEGALLWLRDLTRGREEQLFVLAEDGEQIFI